MDPYSGSGVEEEGEERGVSLKEKEFPDTAKLSLLA
jgi:hypothetical protein